MPTGEQAVMSIQSLITVMGGDTNGIDGNFGEASMAAYNALREQYASLPDIGETLDEAEIPQILEAAETLLDDNSTFSQAFVRGLTGEENALVRQGAVNAVGGWANEHLGDRISEAQAVAMDGQAGEMTDRAVRNTIKTTGVSGMQASLNLLDPEANLEIDGLIGDSTRQAMQRYAEANELELVEGDDQANFETITTHLESEGQVAALQVALLAVQANDDDPSAPDLNTESAQVFVSRGGNLTAIDGRFIDGAITMENSQTEARIRTVAGEPAAEAAAEVEGTEIVVEASLPPFGINDSFEISRNDVLTEMSDIIARQENNPESAEHVLAYSNEVNSYVLIARSVNGVSNIYQISDDNVALIMPAVSDGSILFDRSANEDIYNTLQRRNGGDMPYRDDADFRQVFAENPTRFTEGTHDSILTTTAGLPDGQTIRFSVDDLHDAADKQDSHSDWSHTDDPRAYQDFTKQLREAAEDVRGGRPIGEMPTWDRYELTPENSVEISLGGQLVRVPTEIWTQIDAQMQRSESAYSTEAEKGQLRVERNAEGQEISSRGDFTVAAADEVADAPDAAADVAAEAAPVEEPSPAEEEQVAPAAPATPAGM
ncbi:MAG: hypothetical protein CMH25_00210 [Micavibrio sp.]|nr:hypothetical protein [Micavibrio sp.]|tara:strand:- start:38796 stop:40601 length:1806 start_codon:yes stop_codon:yes gene_type:complete